MQHVRIAVYKFKPEPGVADRVIELAREGMYEIFRRQPGFVAYDIVKTGEDAGVSISTWVTQEQAEAAAQRAQQWVQHNIAGLVVYAENHVGELAFSSRRA